MGAFWAVEHGLYRSKAEIARGGEKVLFNELYKVQQRSVTKKVNNAMQKNVPPGTPK